jgi:hypothetical protein
MYAVALRADLTHRQTDVVTVLSRTCQFPGLHDTHGPKGALCAVWGLVATVTEGSLGEVLKVLVDLRVDGSGRAAFGGAGQDGGRHAGGRDAVGAGVWR